MPSTPRPNRDHKSLRAQRDQLMADIEQGHLELGEAVRRMREISGLTQEQFAKHRNLSLLTLKQIETGKGNPTVATLDKIGRIFGLAVGFTKRREAGGKDPG